MLNICGMSFVDVVSSPLTLPGVALKHVYEKVFTLDSGMRRNVPKVVVAVTDGRSQDEVKKNAARLQHAGMTHCQTVKVMT